MVIIDGSFVPPEIGGNSRSRFGDMSLGPVLVLARPCLIDHVARTPCQ